MANSQTSPPGNVEIITALPEHEPILANLLELYAHDFSEFIDIQLGVDGRFGYKQLPLYWKEPDRYPFLIMIDGHWAGFVFVHRGSRISDNKDVWDMAEFFVVRSYRRQGIGMRVAHEIWKKFPGKWEVRVLDRNQKAKQFWASSIDQLMGKKINPVTFNKDGEAWHIFSFESALPKKSASC